MLLLGPKFRSSIFLSFFLISLSHFVVPNLSLFCSIFFMESDVMGVLGGIFYYLRLFRKSGVLLKDTQFGM